jgi:Cof subfamily protein (haloacid dehalogenase superfamily)
MASKKISIVLSDVDGTLVDGKKRITERAKAAIQQLSDAGIRFSVASSRPPRGMKMIADQITLSAPMAALNGGMVVDPGTMKVLNQHTLDDETARSVIERVDGYGLDVWVYAGVNWYLRNLNGPHREEEESIVRFAPTEVKDFESALNEGVAKVLGVSDDFDLVARVEKAIQDEFQNCSCARSRDQARDCEPRVCAARSYPFYLDVTHPNANKGAVVETLSELLQIPAAEFATIGDMPNDVLMFRKSGYSIAMGQANADVKKSATAVTAEMDDEGFAKAIENLARKSREPKRS